MIPHVTIPSARAKASAILDGRARVRLSALARSLFAARLGRRGWSVEVEVDVPWVDPDRVLAECEGFLVDGSDGREIGVVDRVEPSEHGAAAALLVAGGLFGGRRLRVDACGVETVVPVERRLIVDPSRVTAVGDAGRS